MNTWQTILTVSVSAFVALLAVLVRPILENWFEHRRRRIVFRWDSPVISKTPLATVKLKWGNYEVDQIVVYQCRLENRTGKTLRNVVFTLSAPLESSDGFCFIGLDKSNRETTSRDCKIKKANSSTYMIIFSQLERGYILKLYVATSEEIPLSLRTDSDLEIIQFNSGARRSIREFDKFMNYFYYFATGLTAVMVGVIISGLLS